MWSEYSFPMCSTCSNIMSIYIFIFFSTALQNMLTMFFIRLHSIYVLSISCWKNFDKAGTIYSSHWFSLSLLHISCISVGNVCKASPTNEAGVFWRSGYIFSMWIQVGIISYTGSCITPFFECSYTRLILIIVIIHKLDLHHMFDEMPKPRWKSNYGRFLFMAQSIKLIP